MNRVWNSKKECRSFYKSLCTQEFARGLVQNQQELDFHLCSFLKTQSGLWGAYRALPEEAQVEEVFNVSHLEWAFPRMRNGSLDFFKVHQFVLGPFGVLEPTEDSPLVTLQEIRGLLIPGLVFNKNGSRLGKGKGFYDKTLSNYKGIKVGVGFDFQISTSPIPTEEHDVTMDLLVTESGLIDCRKYQE